MEAESRAGGLACPLCCRPDPGPVCCGVRIEWVWADRREYEAQYRGAYHGAADRARLGLASYADRFEEHCRAARCRLEWLHLPPGSRLLDIGAGNGALVWEAHRQGLNAAGLEPSREMCDWFREQRGLRLLPGGWEELRGRWDLITACDVFEHLLFPARFLARCRDHSDRLYLETPDWHAGRPADWKHIKPREHPYLYSEAALSALAGRCGWRVERSVRPIEGKLALLCKAEPNI